MIRTVFAAALCAAGIAGAAPDAARALTFSFQKSFDVAAFGSSGGGTPRGLALMGDALLVSDALDDQIYVVDPVSETATSTWETDPFACALGACVPTTEWARIVWDVAWDGSSVWVVDKELVDGSTTWLIELNASGEFLQRIDADVAGASPGGLTFDPRGAGGLLLSDRGSDTVTHFDAGGVAIGLSSLAGISGAPTGIAYFGADLFFVSDSGDDTVYEVLLPSGGGAATPAGETVFQGFDIETLLELESVDYDPVDETLYLLDGASDRVYVFQLVPEPGTGALLALGLGLLAARRRRR